VNFLPLSVPLTPAAPCRFSIRIGIKARKRLVETQRAFALLGMRKKRPSVRDAVTRTDYGFEELRAPDRDLINIDKCPVIDEPRQHENPL